MRWVLAVAVVPIALAAHADTIRPGVTGNDSGGIIQWGPDAQYFYRDVAAYHCARFNKIAVISSVHRMRTGEPFEVELSTTRVDIGGEADTGSLRQCLAHVLDEFTDVLGANLLWRQEPRFAP